MRLPLTALFISSLLAGCSMSVITKPNMIVADTATIVDTQADYTEIRASAQPLGTCATSTKNPFVDTNLSGTVLVRVRRDSDAPILLPLVSKLTELCKKDLAHTANEVLSYRLSETTVDVVIASGSDVRLTKLAKSAAALGALAATGGAANTITAIEALTQTNEAAQFSKDFESLGTDVSTHFVSLPNPWSSRTFPAYLVKADFPTTLGEAEAAYSANPTNALFTIAVTRRSLVSKLWRELKLDNDGKPIGSPPSSTEILAQKVRYAVGPLRTLLDVTRDKVIPADAALQPTSCLQWKGIADMHHFGTWDMALYLRAMFNADPKTPSIPAPAALDACEIPEPVKAKWRLLYPTDWAAHPPELAIGQPSKEIWKRGVAKMLQQAKKTLATPDDTLRQTGWQHLLSGLSAGHPHTQVLINGDDLRVVSDKTRTETITRLTTLGAMTAGCLFPPGDSTDRGMLLAVQDANPWKVRIALEGETARLEIFRTKVEDPDLSPFHKDTTDKYLEGNCPAVCSKLP